MPSRSAAVIFAVDVGVRDRRRFAGKPVVSSGVKRPIDDGDAMIAEALRYADDPNAPRVEGDGVGCRRRSTGGESFGRTPPRPDDRRVLHDPVRGGGRSADRARLPVRRLRDRRRRPARSRQQHASSTCPTPARSASTTRCSTAASSPTSAPSSSSSGPTAFKFFVPALAGYIAYAIADRPGIAPGFVMGALAADRSACRCRAPARRTGFLGAHHRRRPGRRRSRHWIARWKVPTVGSRPDARPGHPAARP